MIRVRIRTLPKLGVLDPQGEAVARGLHALGHSHVQVARVGRLVELDLDTDDRDEAFAAAEVMCRELLVNDVVERGEIDIVELDAAVFA